MLLLQQNKATSDVGNHCDVSDSAQAVAELVAHHAAALLYNTTWYHALTWTAGCVGAFLPKQDHILYCACFSQLC